MSDFFEVGKKYKNKNLNHIRACWALSPVGEHAMLGNDPNASYTSPYVADKREFQYYTEYKKPVVHKRYVHWYKGNKEIGTHTSDVKTDTVYGFPVLRVDEVTYTEE